jgi:hypothetical protein
MRYVYRSTSAVPGTVYQGTQRVRTETVSTTEPQSVDSEIEVYVSMDQYDSILALFGSPDLEPIPSDIAAVFQHRGPFTIICDPRA